ncbi:glutathione S-transferase [Shewanella sp. A25]|nr:glutathione S-transferase [Shewanella shenzhenensis]
MITLYGMPKSRALRVAWVLEELGVDWNFSFVDMNKAEHRSPQFLALNPCAKVPVLTDGDLVMSESAAICQYLAEKFGQLLPEAGSVASGKHHQWVSFIITELEQPLWTLGKHKFALPMEQRHPSIMPCAVWEFDKAAALAESMLPETEFLLGDEICVADILLAHTLMWGTLFEQQIPPKLAAYRDRLAARPSRKSALKKMEVIAAQNQG